MSFESALRGPPLPSPLHSSPPPTPQTPTSTAHHAGGGGLDEGAALMYAAEQGAVRSVQTWQLRGGDINAYYYSPVSADNPAPHVVYTALQYASFLGHATAVRTLLECGANPDGALCVACEHGHSAAVEALLEFGVDAGRGDERGQTPTHFAAAFGRTACLRQLIRYGADVTARDDTGKTPLELAVAAGHADTAYVLRHAAGIVESGSHTAVVSSAAHLTPMPQPPTTAMPMPMPMHGMTHSPHASQTLRPGFHVPAHAPMVPMAPMTTATGAHATAAADAQSRLHSWLCSIALGHLFPGFLLAGYDDVDFVAKAGLSDADIQSILEYLHPEAAHQGFGLPPGSRRKLGSLYNIEHFVTPPPKPSAPESSGASDDDDDDEEEDDDDDDDDDSEDDDDDDDDDEDEDEDEDDDDDSDEE